MPKFIRPTLETKFHIDFSWWQEKNQNLRAFLQSHACEACQEAAHENENQTFDWINPHTAEVFQLDLLWHLIQTHCAQDTNFINSQMPLTSVIFRAFIVNNNTPLTPVEVYEVVKKQSPDLILKTIGGRQIYNGIKPAA